MSARSAWFLLAAGLGFVAVGAFIVYAGDPEDRIKGVASMVFFGACALVGAMALLPKRALAPDADGVVTLFPDRIQVLGIILGAGGMSAGSYFIGRMADADGSAFMVVICWVGVVFFGLGAVLGAWRLFNLKPTARLDAEGVHAFGRMGWSLRWRDIVGVTAIDIASQRFVAFETARTSPSTFSDRANDALGMPRHILGVSGTGVRFEDFHAHALAFWSTHRGR